MSSPSLESTPASPQAERLGLLAGEGLFPRLIAQAAREQAIPVTAFGMRGVTSPELESDVHRMHWFKIGQFDHLIRMFHDGGISKTIMAGRIKHSSIFNPLNLDKRGLKMMARLRNLKADSILTIVTEELESENIHVLDSTLFLRGAMPAEGLLTPACPPNESVRQDIAFGVEHARAIAGLDVGQTIIVKRLSVVAVEAMEGTDAAILRAGEIAGPGTVAVKVSKPSQDARFDVPVLGLTTVKNLIEARAAALAFPGGEVLLFDRDEAVKLAEAAGLTIVAV